MFRDRTGSRFAVAALALLIPLGAGCQWGLVDESNYAKGAELFLAGQYASAEAPLRAFVTRYPSSSRAAEARCLLGSIALRRGSTREAEQEFQACLRRSPGEQLAARARLGVARCYFQRGEYRQCREACLDIFRDEPSTPRADEVLFLLAEASEHAGLTADARRHFREVTERYPTSPFAAKARSRLEGSPAVPPAAPGGRFHVQVAAFASAARAAEHARLLRERGYPARTATVGSGGRTLHAVQVGPYATEAAAEQAAKRLRAEGFSVLIKP
jgi:TolA-binding protein